MLWAWRGCADKASARPQMLPAPIPTFMLKPKVGCCCELASLTGKDGAHKSHVNAAPETNLQRRGPEGPLPPTHRTTQGSGAWGGLPTCTCSPHARAGGLHPPWAGMAWRGHAPRTAGGSGGPGQAEAWGRLAAEEGCAPRAQAFPKKKRRSARSGEGRVPPSGTVQHRPLTHPGGAPTTMGGSPSSSEGFPGRRQSQAVGPRRADS